MAPGTAGGVAARSRGSSGAEIGRRAAALEKAVYVVDRLRRYPVVVFRAASRGREASLDVVDARPEHGKVLPQRDEILR